MADTPPSNPDQPTPANTEIGVDRWVSEADERRDRGGLGGRIQRLWGGLPPSGKLALLTPAIFLPFLPLSEATIYNYGLFIHMTRSSRSVSTSSSALRGCSTSVTSRSSASAPTPTHFSRGPITRRGTSTRTTGQPSTRS